jgi:hypothetical protein
MGIDLRIPRSFYEAAFVDLSRSIASFGAEHPDSNGQSCYCTKTYYEVTIRGNARSGSTPNHPNPGLISKQMFNTIV